MKLIKIGLIALLIGLVAYQWQTNNRTQGISDSPPLINSDVDEIIIPCQYEEQDLLQGLTAYDAEDGYLTEKILVGGITDFTDRGVSSINYAVYDKDGNIATYTRQVVFSDYAPPIISIEAPLVFKAVDNPYYAPALNANGSDMLDGDISRRILLSSDDLDFTKPGNYSVSVYLKNSFGDEVTMDLPVHILDPSQSGYTIELKDPIIYVDKGSDVNPKDYLVAVKNEYSNEIVSTKDYKLTIKSEIDTSKAGIYEIQYVAVSADKVQRGETWLTVVVGDYGG